MSGNQDDDGYDDGGSLQSFYTKYPAYQDAVHVISEGRLPAERRRMLQVLTGILSELQACPSPNPLWVAMVRSGIGSVLTESEEKNEGERILLECITILAPYKSEACLQLILSFNALAVVRFQRGDIETAKMYLERAEHFFHDAPSEGRSEKDRNLVEHLNTQTVFLLAQVYSQGSDSGTAAFYCHKTLHQQILFRTSNPDFDAIEWSLNAVKLSAFYVNNNRLRQAKYCIEASLSVLPDGQSDRHRFANADISCAFAEIYGRWLHLSAHAYQTAGSSDSSGTCQLDNSVDQFASLSVPIPDCFSTAQNLKDAQSIYREGFSHFQAALAVYTLDGFVSDHVVLLQKSSALLKDLSAFSTDHSFLCKLYKRRIDLLEPIIQKLNPKIYVDFTRQLLHEVAQIYSEMADHKVEQIKHVPADQKLARVEKINSLTSKSIKYFEKFMNSLRDSGSIETTFLYSFLKAKFQVARLYSRFIYLEVELQIKALKSSLLEYDGIVQMCRRKRVPDFQEELYICQEMCSLLPFKLQSLVGNTK